MRDGRARAFHPVAPVLLGAVKRGVRHGHHPRALIAMVGIARHTGRQTDGPQRLAAQFDIQMFHRFPQLFGTGCGDVEVGTGQDEREFLATVAAGDVFAAGVARDELSECCQQGIAAFMAVVIVETLEVIDIEHDDRERLLATACAGCFARQRIFHVAAVEKSRQRIVQRLMTQRFLQMQVGQRERQLLGDRLHRLAFGIGETIAVLAAKAENAHGLALRDQGKQ